MAYKIEELPEELKLKIPEPEPRTDAGFRIPVSYPYIPPGAKERVIKAIEEATISSATSVVREFEEELRKFFEVPFAKACNSGYSALVLALKLSNIGPGDHVLVPSLTMVAVANAVITVGAKPVFVDCEEGQFNPSVAEYQNQITMKSRALIVTHTYGIAANCEELVSFCKEKGLVLIEDIAEAIGTDYKGKMVGTFGDFACASLYANKTITSGDGGFILSSKKTDFNLTERADSYVNHGFTKEYHFLHFEHSGNYKMSGLEAAFVLPAVTQIPKVMEDRTRISNLYRKYLDGVPGLKLMPRNPNGRDAPWMFGVMVKSISKRRIVRNKLAEQGIETRGFFFPLHLQPMMLDPTNGKIAELPNSEKIGTTGFYLPTYYNLSEKDIKDVCECLKKSL